MAAGMPSTFFSYLPDALSEAMTPAWRCRPSGRKPGEIGRMSQAVNAREPVQDSSGQTDKEPSFE